MPSRITLCTKEEFVSISSLPSDFSLENFSRSAIYELLFSSWQVIFSANLFEQFKLLL